MQKTLVKVMHRKIVFVKVKSWIKHHWNIWKHSLV